MKRPLCVVCLLLLVCLIIYANIFLTNEDVGKPIEGRLQLIGEIVQKEVKLEGSEQTTILYIKSSQYQLANDSSSSSQSNLFQKQKIGVICYIKNTTMKFLIGQRIQISGNYMEMEGASNPGQFDAKSYYSRLGYKGFLFDCNVEKIGANYSLARECLYQIKAHISNTISEIYVKEDEGLIKGILLGIKGEIEDEIKKLYQRNGIIHLLAISGLHISILGVGCYEGLRKCKLPIIIATLLSCIVMILYGVLIGASISVIRAIGMFLLRSLSIVIGRTYDIATSLSLLAVFLLVLEPRYSFDSGFWLSFGSVLAIIILLPVMKVEGGSLKEGFLASAAITSMTLPILLYFYYEVATYSILLNLLVIPLMSFLMGGVVINVILAYVIQCINALCYVCFSIKVQYFLYYSCYMIASLQGMILKVIEYSCYVFEYIPGHSWLVGRPSMIQIILYYIILLAIIIVHYKEVGEEKVRKKYCIVGIILLPLLFLVPAKTEVEVHFLDVGQGDCTIIFYQEHTIILDGGSTSEDEVGKYRIIPFLKYYGRNKIDAIFITHPDADHYNGLTQLMELAKGEGIEIKQLFLPKIKEESVANGEGMVLIEETAKKAKIKITYITVGHDWVIGNMEVSCLHPSLENLGTDPNQYSIVLYLAYESFSMLAMGDAQEMAENMVLEQLKMEKIKDVTVLKVGHHGARLGSSALFLEQVNPKMAIISCGKNNSYGHPDDAVLGRLEEKNSQIYITYDSGEIALKIKDEAVIIKQFLE